MSSLENRNPLDVVADDFARRLRQGEQPSIEAYAREYPDHADEILELLPTIAAMEGFGEKEICERKFTTRIARLMEDPTEAIGDFRITREIGRGGMGVVYEAEQQSLKRRVALKILAPHIASSPTQLERFRHEAKAAARLHHTNIIPVFGIGENDGTHYFAMQFIDGIPLSSAIRIARRAGRRAQTDRESSADQELSTPTGQCALTGAARAILNDDADQQQTEPATDHPQPETAAPTAKDHWKSVARIAADVADALAYAHQHGVLHRDIKPSNLLLDQEGAVWVADFGVAKHEDSVDVTNCGEMIGTIQYMAPEQFSGQADQQSDVYGLGVTLYEMLTLQPAYTGTHQGVLIRRKTSRAPTRRVRSTPPFRATWKRSP